VEDKKLCPRYTAVKIENITVAESPAWLKERLVAVNQRPVNNIVDLTNYVMLECGQPLHAFDAAKVKKIVVRPAEKDEALETLDKKERILNAGDLVIADGKNILAIAGVMGGENSEIGQGTKSLILESANFLAPAVRRTSQRLGLRTEASARFEKALDPNLTEIALKRFMVLLKEICPSMKISSALMDINSVEEKKIEIDLSLDWLTEKIGQEIPRAQVLSLLTKLGFEIKNEKESVLKIIVPSWRATKDISAREDIVEEVLRLYGYDRIESQLLIAALQLPETNPERDLERRVKNSLSLKHSLTEVYNYSFVGSDQLRKLKVEFSNYLRLVNPLSDVQTMLRQSLAPGLISNLKINQAKAEEIGFFEIGNVFFGAPGNIRKDATTEERLPYQEKHLGVILAGGGDLFGRLKGLVNNLFQMVVRRDVLTVFSPLELTPGWVDGRVAARISLLGEEIGLVAAVSRETAEALNLKKSAVLAEINFTALADLVLSLPPFRFQEESKYPAVTRDLAFVVKQKILYNDLKKELLDFNPLIKAVEIFDVYAGDKLETGQKSLAFHLTYQAEDRTLRAVEIDKLQAELIARLAKKFSAKLRDF
jgi:phenylalanyl-tRNA synthetase beta chain